MTPKGQKFIDLFFVSLDSTRDKTSKRVITERESKVLKLIYDFEENTFTEYSEVAVLFERSRERIRQIHNKSLKKISVASINPNCYSKNCRELRNLLNPNDNREIEDLVALAVNFWKKNLEEFSFYETTRLIASLLTPSPKKLKDVNGQIKKWLSTQKAELKKNQIKEYKRLKKRKEILLDQERILNQVVWFDKKSKWNLDSKELLPVRNIENNDKYISGKIYSKKCGRDIQYESGIEKTFINYLESFPRVLKFSEQPITLNYEKAGVKRTYTPDFIVFLEDKTGFFVEVKDLTGMCDARVQRRIEVLLEYCKKYGFGILLTDCNMGISKLLDYPIDPDFENDLKAKLMENGGRTIFFNEFKTIQNNYTGKWTELLAMVLKNNWALYPFPFKLNSRNNYISFRKEIITTANTVHK
ncbi:MAG: TnsA endonuclease N-terminal domain-containing protein [Bacteroidota bacterium]